MLGFGKVQSSVEFLVMMKKAVNVKDAEKFYARMWLTLLCD